MTLEDLRNAREQLRLRKQFAMILRNQQEQWAYGRTRQGVGWTPNDFILFRADVNINGDVVSGGLEY